MKKSIWLLAFLPLALTVGCNSNNNSSTPTSIPNSTSHLSSSVIPDSTSLDSHPIYKLIENFDDYYQERRDVTITKDNTTYYNETHSITIDTKNYIRYEFDSKSGYSDFENIYGLYEVTKEYYYNGEYQYVYEEDRTWYRSENTAQKVEVIKSKLDLTPLLTDTTVETSGFNYIVKKTLSADEVDTFLPGTQADITTLELQVTANTENITRLSYNYEQNGFNVDVAYTFGFTSGTLSLPVYYQNV